MGSYSWTIQIFSEDTFQSQLITEGIERNATWKVESCRYSRATPQRRMHPVDCIVIDYETITSDFEECYYSLKSMLGIHAKEVLLNCPRTLNVGYLFKWTNLYGVFYTDDDFDSIRDGLICIKNGKMHLDAETYQNYILTLRSHLPTLPPSMQAPMLNKKDYFLLQLLCDGLDEQTICIKLRISHADFEEQVSGLYDKINAKDRVQACVWAQSNIGLSPNFDLMRVYHPI